MMGLYRITAMWTMLLFTYTNTNMLLMAYKYYCP